MKELRRVACASHHFRDAIAFPHSQQKHLRAGGIFKDIKNVCIAVHFKKTRSSCIGAQRCAHAQEQSQF